MAARHAGTASVGGSRLLPPTTGAGDASCLAWRHGVFLALWRAEL